MKSIAQLNAELAGLCPGGIIAADNVERSLHLIGSYLQERYHVSYDEVAVFKLVDSDHLCFVLPGELAAKGSIPINASQSVAAKTASSMKANCYNDFQSQRHITFFEGIKFKADIKGLIQRMLCSPIVLDNKVVGVIQISRKGPDQVQCGPPFAQADLEDLVQFCQTIARHFETIFNSMNE